MPTRSQRVITTPTGKIGPTDLSRTVYLRGNAPQTITGPDKDGIDACIALALAMALALTGCKTWPFGAKTSGPDVCCLAGPCSGGEPPCE